LPRGVDGPDYRGDFRLVSERDDLIASFAFARDGSAATVTRPSGVVSFKRSNYELLASDWEPTTYVAYDEVGVSRGRRMIASVTAEQLVISIDSRAGSYGIFVGERDGCD
jgi:hypothetical protein